MIEEARVGAHSESRSARLVAFRSRIVLECTGGASNAMVAAELRTIGRPRRTPLSGHRRRGA